MERPSRTLQEKRIRNIAHYFDVKKFPFSTIAITRVASVNGEHKEITGNLTIKGITHPVTFPVKMEMKDGIVKASGKLVIDRTKWDVRYKSGKFFDDLKLKTSMTI
ncbi:YceI family protein [Paraflavitalea devenefica]|uniref:YceI family protein n=1 Tax=Paraflavitalea devenefica TaxID=2716334 RepID=UPI001ABAA012|nr:YceI family protein [Paraflavitalea devenefica]